MALPFVDTNDVLFVIAKHLRACGLSASAMALQRESGIDTAWLCGASREVALLREWVFAGDFARVRALLEPLATALPHEEHVAVMAVVEKHERLEAFFECSDKRHRHAMLDKLRAKQHALQLDASELALCVRALLDMSAPSTTTTTSCDSAIAAGATGWDVLEARMQCFERLVPFFRGDIDDSDAEYKYLAMSATQLLALLHDAVAQHSNDQEASSAHNEHCASAAVDCISVRTRTRIEPQHLSLTQQQQQQQQSNHLVLSPPASAAALQLQTHTLADRSRLSQSVDFSAVQSAWRSVESAATKRPSTRGATSQSMRSNVLAKSLDFGVARARRQRRHKRQETVTEADDDDDGDSASDDGSDSQLGASRPLHTLDDNHERLTGEALVAAVETANVPQCDAATQTEDFDTRITTTTSSRDSDVRVAASLVAPANALRASLLVPIAEALPVIAAPPGAAVTVQDAFRRCDSSSSAHSSCESIGVAHHKLFAVDGTAATSRTPTTQPLALRPSPPPALLSTAAATVVAATPPSAVDSQCSRSFTSDNNASKAADVTRDASDTNEIGSERSPVAKHLDSAADDRIVASSSSDDEGELGPDDDNDDDVASNDNERDVSYPFAPGASDVHARRSLNDHQHNRQPARYDQLSANSVVQMRVVAEVREAHAVRAIDVSADGAQLAIGTNARALRIFDVAAPLARASVAPSQSHSVLPLLPVLAERHTHHQAAIYCVAYNNTSSSAPAVTSGQTTGGVVATGDADSSIKVLALATGHEVALASRTGKTRALQFAADHLLWVAGSSDLRIRCWDLERAAPSVDLDGHVGEIQALALPASSDSGDRMSRLLSAALDKSVRLWDARSGRCEQLVARTAQSALTLQFDPSDALCFASGHCDGTVRVWDLRTTARALATLTHHRDACRTLSWSPNGAWLLTGALDGTICVLQRTSALATLRAHGGDKVLTAMWHPTTPAVVTTGADKLVKLWAFA